MLDIPTTPSYDPVSQQAKEALFAVVGYLKPEEIKLIEKACDLHEDWKTIAILYKQMYDLLAKRYNNPNLKNNNY